VFCGIVVIGPPVTGLIDQLIPISATAATTRKSVIISPLPVPRNGTHTAKPPETNGFPFVPVIEVLKDGVLIVDKLLVKNTYHTPLYEITSLNVLLPINTFGVNIPACDEMVLVETGSTLRVTMLEVESTRVNTYLLPLLVIVGNVYVMVDAAIITYSSLSGLIVTFELPVSSGYVRGIYKCTSIYKYVHIYKYKSIYK
jgi:hypothetical protein